MARHNRVARLRGSVRLAEIRLASRTVRVLRLHHHSLVLGADRRAETVMTVTEITSKRGVMDDDRAAVPSFTPVFDPAVKRHAQHLQVGRCLITLMTVAIAGLLGRAMWGAYMGAPWTRDATVRAYVVMMAPEVSGRIGEWHVVDNKYVRKGDLLMVVDPTNYMIAFSQAEESC